MSLDRISDCKQWQKVCCCQSNSLTLIVKMWKSCCKSLWPLFVFPQRLFNSCLSPPSSSHSLTLTLYLLIPAVLTRTSMLSRKACALWGILTTSTSLSVCYSVLSLSILCLGACLCGTHQFQSLLSVWIKESERLSQLSPSMRIRYCRLLSAVISLPSSDSLSGAAIRYHVSLLWVFVAPCKFCMLSHPILCFQWLYPKADFDASLR